MIDRVSGVANALTLPVLAGKMVGIVLAILALKAVKYAAYPRFMQRAMTQYKNFAFQKLTQKSISAFQAENTAKLYLGLFQRCHSH